jgi:phosphohistidine swiveling domain-containing protein
MTTVAPRQPLPVPDNFPVSWERPEDEHLFWARDRMHRTGQITPLEASIQELVLNGLNVANDSYGIPSVLRCHTINTYSFETNDALPPSEEQAAIIQERMSAVMGQLQVLWEEEWFPAIQSHLAFWEQFDLAAASMPALIDHLDATAQHYEQLWELHFRIVPPAYLAISFFDDLYQDLFGSESPFGAYALLEGFPNKTVEIGQALWHLSRQALADPAVAAILTMDDGHRATHLQGFEEGRRFLTALDAFLQEYGHRNEIWGIREPAWLEDPAPVYRTLRDYVTQPDLDLVADLAAAAHRREERVAAVRAQLNGYPQPVIGQFEFLLRAAQVGTVLSEDHGFWIDFRGSHCLRQVILEFGRRLAAAGAIEGRDDILYLTLEEIRAVAATPDADYRALVAARRAKEVHFSSIEAPITLGTPPPDGPPGGTPIERAFQKFFGGPPPSDSTPELIRGNAGASGRVQGQVRVVHSLAEASKVAPGDILVAVTTAPPWTPLFATVAAVVTDTGGVLSHCAVVAREYGIPAVVGTGRATNLLHDGQWVEVDGSAGTVRLLEAM